MKKAPIIGTLVLTLFFLTGCSSKKDSKNHSSKTHKIELSSSSKKSSNSSKKSQSTSAQSISSSSAPIVPKSPNVSDTSNASDISNYSSSLTSSSTVSSNDTYNYSSSTTEYSTTAPPVNTKKLSPDNAPNKSIEPARTKRMDVGYGQVFVSRATGLYYTTVMLSSTDDFDKLYINLNKTEADAQGYHPAPSNTQYEFYDGAIAEKSEQYLNKSSNTNK